MWLDLFLTNIEASHPGAKQLLKKGGIAVARSLIPGALSIVDKTMEESAGKHAMRQIQSIIVTMVACYLFKLPSTLQF